LPDGGLDRLGAVGDEQELPLGVQAPALQRDQQVADYPSVLRRSVREPEHVLLAGEIDSDGPDDHVLAHADAVDHHRDDVLGNRAFHQSLQPFRRPLNQPARDARLRDPDGFRSVLYGLAVVAGRNPRDRRLHHPLSGPRVRAQRLVSGNLRLTARSAPHPRAIEAHLSSAKVHRPSLATVPHVLPTGLAAVRRSRQTRGRHLQNRAHDHQPGLEHRALQLLAATFQEFRVRKNLRFAKKCARSLTLLARMGVSFAQGGPPVWFSNPSRRVRQGPPIQFKFQLFSGHRHGSYWERPGSWGGWRQMFVWSDGDGPATHNELVYDFSDLYVYDQSGTHLLS